MADLSRFLGFGLRTRTSSMEPLTAKSAESEAVSEHRHRHRHSNSKSSDHRHKPRAIPRVASLFGLSGRDSRQSHRSTPSPSPTTTATSTSSSPRVHTPDPLPEEIRVVLSPVAKPPEISSPVISTRTITPPAAPPEGGEEKGVNKENISPYPRDDGFNIDKPRLLRESIWHDPTFLHKVEGLLVAMMTRASRMDSLPVEYNSHVLAILEGVENLFHHLAQAKKELAEQKNLREKELEQFRGVSEDWIQREREYKAEIKRLELTLARESKDGMACVALTRHGSLVDRAASKKFQQRIQRLSNHGDDKPANLPHDYDEPRDSWHLVPNLDMNKSIDDLVRSATKYARTNSETNPKRRIHCVNPTSQIPRFVSPNNDTLMNQIVARGLVTSTVRHGPKRIEVPRGKNSISDQPQNQPEGIHTVPEPGSTTPQPGVIDVQSHCSLEVSPNLLSATVHESSTPDSSTNYAGSSECPILKIHQVGLEEKTDLNDRNNDRNDSYRRTADQLRHVTEGHEGPSLQTKFEWRKDCGNDSVGPGDDNATLAIDRYGLHSATAQSTIPGSLGNSEVTANKGTSTLASAREPSKLRTGKLAKSDYFSPKSLFQQQNHRPQRRRGFSFIEGDDEILPLSPALPVAINKTNPTGGSAAPYPPLTTSEHPGGGSSPEGLVVGRSILSTPVSADLMELLPERTTDSKPASRTGSKCVFPSTSRSLPTSTSTNVTTQASLPASDSAGSVVYLGSNLDDTAKGFSSEDSLQSKDSTSSRVTVIRCESPLAAFEDFAAESKLAVETSHSTTCSGSPTPSSVTPNSSNCNLGGATPSPGRTLGNNRISDGSTRTTPDTAARIAAIRAVARGNQRGFDK